MMELKHDIQIEMQRHQHLAAAPGADNHAVQPAVEEVAGRSVYRETVCGEPRRAPPAEPASTDE